MTRTSYRFVQVTCQQHVEQVRLRLVMTSLCQLTDVTELRCVDVTQLMTSAVDDNAGADVLRQAYLDDRCAYLTEQLTRHRTQQQQQVQRRNRTWSVSVTEGVRQKQMTSVNGRQRFASAQVLRLTHRVYRVRTGRGKSWKVLESKCPIFKNLENPGIRPWSWRILESYLKSFGKSWKTNGFG